ncbi:MAG: cysteine desulfurase [Candidatus Marinimicrobia bacterium]|nr:cysteine desulfurase [Candidatus Neomarinimicrobiota bacterium]
MSSFKSDFPVFTHDPTLVYLDSASTTQKPKPVIDAMTTFYEKQNANVHRALYNLGEEATNAYEGARKKVAQFVHAPSDKNIIFTRGTTESINLVAYAWGRNFIQAGDEILITEMEHHSNLVPWQLLAKETGATLKYIPMNSDGLLELDHIDSYFTSKTKLLSMVHQSNVLGTLNPVEMLNQKAKSVGAVTMLDAAQSVPHKSVDYQKLGYDFMAFSGHKMLGPTGVGVLVGDMKILDEMSPFLGGGEMINSVTMDSSTWNDVPYKFEAGTPNIAQAVGLGSAIDYMNNIGMNTIESIENELTEYALEKMKKIDGIILYGPIKRGPVISFNIDGIHAHDLATFLNQDNIAIRVGHHCAQPIMDKLNVPSTARVSFHIYNSKQDIDTFCSSLKQTQSYF